MGSACTLQLDTAHCTSASCSRTSQVMLCQIYYLSFICFRQVERKRARNRVAASKCRMRKLERISVLDHQANQLRTENEQLVKLADKLRSQVYSLKQELRWHINNGCRLQVCCPLIKFIHSEKATKFCEISTEDLTVPI